MKTLEASRNVVRLALSLAAAALLAPLAIAGEAEGANEAPSVEEIVNKANLAAYYQGQDGKAKVHMTITDAQGRTREREFVILRRDEKDGGDQKFYVYFSSPPDVRRMVYLVWKHTDKDDDRWLYLPALDLVKRIAASDKRTSFVGSHFLYEDVSGRNVNDDQHELIETTAEHYVLKNTPKDAKSVEFSSYKLWVRKDNFLPEKAEYLDRDGKLHRVVEALEIKEIEGFPTVTKSSVKDLKSGGNTVSVFSEVKYDLGLPDRVFAERFLRRAPRSYLR